MQHTPATVARFRTAKGRPGGRDCCVASRMDPKTRAEYRAVTIGVALGVVIGMFTDNVVMGIAVGLALGIAASFETGRKDE